VRNTNTTPHFPSLTIISSSTPTSSINHLQKFIAQTYLLTQHNSSKSRIKAGKSPAIFDASLIQALATWHPEVNPLFQQEAAQAFSYALYLRSMLGQEASIAPLQCLG
jgi:hypothetical protein